MKLSKSQKIQIIENIEDKIVPKTQLLNSIRDVIHNDPSQIFNSLRRIKKIEYLFQNYYYINSEEERVRGIKKYSMFELIAVVLNKLNIKWYFGLHTANDINKVVWQPSKTIYIINNKFSKKIKIDNQSIHFHKMKKELINNYQIHKTRNRIQLHISNNEKTLEDFVYLNKQPPIELKNIVEK